MLKAEEQMELVVLKAWGEHPGSGQVFLRKAEPELHDSAETPTARSYDLLPAFWARHSNIGFLGQ